MTTANASLPILRGSSEDPISLQALQAYREGQPLPTLKQIECLHVLDQCIYPGLTFKATLEDGRLYLRVGGSVVDAESGLQMDHWGRKWRLSPHMTHGELVQTAFLAVATWEEHERRERFKFMGRSVMEPHFDIYKLVDLCDDATGHLERDNS